MNIAASSLLQSNSAVDWHLIISYLLPSFDRQLEQITVRQTNRRKRQVAREHHHLNSSTTHTHTHTHTHIVND